MEQTMRGTFRAWALPAQAAKIMNQTARKDAAHFYETHMLTVGSPNIRAAVTMSMRQVRRRVRLCLTDLRRLGHAALQLVNLGFRTVDGGRHLD